MRCDKDKLSCKTYLGGDRRRERIPVCSKSRFHSGESAKLCGQCPYHRVALEKSIFCKDGQVPELSRQG